MKQTILVVAAHPDDEILGCGGTIAWHAARGDLVHILILGEGATSRDANRKVETRQPELDALNQTAIKSSKILGAQSIHFASLPDNRMDSIPLLDIVKIVENYVSQFKPQTLYTHHFGDLNLDHRLTQQAVITACRPQPHSCVKELFFFETPSSTEWQCTGSSTVFQPHYFVDISKTWNLKLEALRIYQAEMREWPHSRSIEAIESLAKWRGASIGVNAAEGFSVGRIIRN